ncbi:putative PMR5 domain, PC-Esterase, protein trichome birefringence-like 2 [Rosa chinensis]|uniref:Putative PMR5 domain, PC-Esterase, protein trichome birefringence-like 2 n=2 Tax=Rosa chinensis TaxID=74649 RepID=A0A2P6R3F6_ROSCH|nr:protein trichome birefringence-like 2 isoform X1 [Rosa chinensis]PRQ40980.1 putative PMR5 domain, PC-Esterase, protein trichome birefringence-like 2 [Rosa chinensis]
MHCVSAMDSKKLEQFFSPRRKVVSGFSFGIGASLFVIAVLFVSYSLKSPTVDQGFYTVNSSFVSWPFSFSSTANAVTSEMQDSVDLNKTQLGNFTEEVKDGSSGVEGGRVEHKDGEFGSNEGGGVLGIFHLGNSSEILNNGSLHVEGGGGKETVLEKTQMGNFTEAVKDGSFVVEEGRVQQKDNNSDSRNSSEILKFESLHGEGGKGIGNLSLSKKEDVHEEKTVEGSFSKNSSNGDGKVTEDHQGNSTQKNEIIELDSQTWEMPSDSDKKCDIFDGKWVRDDSKPYYPGGSCPHVDKVWNCHSNRRPDSAFLKWKWQPNGCDIPSLNATDFLERLRGKRLVFVGDSLNRNMWESLVCILRHSVPHKKKVYEISGKKEFKKKGIYAFRFEEYNCSLDFVVAPFLVRESTFTGKNGSFETLRLDLMDRTTTTYRDADVIVFNTGHWWTHEKTSRGEDYYQEGNYVHPRLKALEAYKRALTTWARWVDRYINANRTRVFFRGYSVTHFSGGQWNSGGQCHKETEPIFNETYLTHYPSKMRALESVLKEMKTPVTYLNISRLTDYRKDGHPSIYRTIYKTKEEQIAAEQSQDCSHWCLPGVPDTWNELLYALLLQTGWGSGQK